MRHHQRIDLLQQLLVARLVGLLDIAEQHAQRRVGVLQFAGAFDHTPCGLVERVLQGGFEPSAFGDLDQRPQGRLDHAGERLQPLAEQQRVVVALAVEHADRAEHVAAGPFQGIADVEAHPVGQILVTRPDRVEGRVLDHQLAVVVEHALAIEQCV